MEREDILFRVFGKFLPEGTILFNENDPGDELYYIQSGGVRLRGAGGETVLGAGDILGEEILQERVRRKEMAEVTSDSRLLVIRPEDVGKLVRLSPELSAAIMDELMKKLDESWDRQRNLLYALHFVKIDALLSRAESDRSWSVGEISSETQVEETGVRRVLEKMVEKKALQKDGENYRIADRSVIEKMASELQ